MQLGFEVSFPADDLAVLVYHLTHLELLPFFLVILIFHGTMCLKAEVIHVFRSSFCSSQNTVLSEFCPRCVFSPIERNHLSLFQEGMLGQLSLHIWSLSSWIPCVRVECIFPSYTD